MTLKIGDTAPDFTLPTLNGESISLSDFKGKQNVILYFYPKDDTPGCTLEACDFRDNLSRLKSSETAVLGVSKDSLDSHKKFRNKYDLNFPLLSDEETKVIDAYGAWKEKSMMGKTFMGIQRSTFLIDKQGIIRAIWHNVKAKGHVKEILDALTDQKQV